jgi:hypothetical protein
MDSMSTNKRVRFRDLPDGTDFRFAGADPSATPDKKVASRSYYNGAKNVIEPVWFWTGTKVQPV